MLRRLIAPFEDLPRAVWRLAAIVVVYRSGTMVLPFLALYLTSQRGLSSSDAGLMLSLYGFGAIFGAWLGGFASEHWGAIRAQIASLAGAALLLTLLPRVDSTVALVALVLLLSVIGEGFRPANSVTVAELAPAHVRMRAYALRRIAMNLGTSVGPAVGGVLAAYSYDLLFVIEASACVVAAVLLRLWLWPTSPILHAADATPETPRSPWRDGYFLALLLFASLLAIIIFQLFVTFPLALHEGRGLPETIVGLAFTINTLIIVALQMPVIGWVAGMRPLRVVAVGALLIGLGFGLLPLARTSGQVALTVVVWTIGEMLTFPLLENLVAGRAGDASRGRYMGAFTATFSTAFLVAPLAGSTVYAELGDTALWLACGGLGALAAVGFVLLEAWERRPAHGTVTS